MSERRRSPTGAPENVGEAAGQRHKPEPVEIYDHGHNEALLKFSSITWRVHEGTFSADKAIIDLLKTYPNDPSTRDKADSIIRASFAASKGADYYKDPSLQQRHETWAKAFWQQNGDHTLCALNEDPMVDETNSTASGDGPSSEDDAQQAIQRVASAGGRSCCDPMVTPMGVACQKAVEVRNDVLLYTTDPLQEPMEVTGDVRFVLHAATSAVDTDWVVRLTDVDETGKSVNVCQGILRARFGTGLEAPQSLTPGECHEYTIPLGPTSWEFGVGHCLRVQVTSSDFPAHDVNTNTGKPVDEVELLDGIVATQVVHHDAGRPSRLILPVAYR